MEFIKDLSELNGLKVDTRVHYKCVYPGCNTIVEVGVRNLKSRDPAKAFYCNHHAKQLARAKYLSVMSSVSEDDYIKSKSEKEISNISELDGLDPDAYVSFYCTKCGKLSGNNVHRLIGKGCLLCGNCSKAKTNIDKFGVEHTFQRQEVREARIAAETEEVQKHREDTFTSRYGVTNPMQNETFKNNCAESNRKNHGGILWQQTEEGRDVVRNFHLDHPEISDKARTTNIFNNNGTHSLALKENREKLEAYRSTHHDEIQTNRRETNIERFGKPEINTYGSEEFKSNMVSKYGVETPYAFGSDNYIKTMIKKYGQDWKSHIGFNSDQFAKTMIEKYGENWHNEIGFGSDKYIKSMIEKYGENWQSHVGFNSEQFVKTMVEKYGEDWKTKIGFGTDQYAKAMVKKYGEDWKSYIGFNSDQYVLTMVDKYGSKLNQVVLKDDMLQPILDKSGNTVNPGSKEYNYLVLDMIKKSNPELFGGTHFQYDGEIFDGSWELAYWIYCKDHNIPIEHEVVTLKYDDPDVPGKSRNYKVDFLVNGKDLVEVKGSQFFKDNDPSKEMVNVFNHDQDARYEAKHQCMIDNDVQVISTGTINPYLNYIESTYGDSYLNLFRLYGYFSRAMFVESNKSFTPFDIDQNKEYQNSGLGLTPFDLQLKA